MTGNAMTFFQFSQENYEEHLSRYRKYPTNEAVKNLYLQVALCTAQALLKKGEHESVTAIATEARKIIPEEDPRHFPLSTILLLSEEIVSLKTTP